MKFLNVSMLYLVWIIPVLLILYYMGNRRRKRILEGFATEKARKSIAPEIFAFNRNIKAILIMASVLFLIVSLAGPQYGFKWQEVEQKGVDLMIAIDCSKSMLASDIKPSRLERAKREVKDLISMVEGDRLGLVAFAGVSFLQCPLTLDYNAFNLFMSNLSPSFIPMGGTDIAGVIKTSMNSFNMEDNTDKAIILITDGENTGDDPLKIAEEARKQNIKIFSIGVGSKNGVPVPDVNGGFKKDAQGKIVLTKIDDTLLKKIAAMTGGTYVHSVAGDMDLEEIYLNRVRSDMKESTLTSGKKKIWDNRYQVFLFCAVALLIIEMMIPVFRKNKTLLLIMMSFLVFSGYQEKAHAFSFETEESRAEKAYQEERFEDAVTHYINAQLDDPDNPEIYYNLGNSYYRTGEFESALSNFQRASETEKENLKGKALYNLGNSHFKMGNYKESLENYEKAVEIFPEDKEISSNIEFVKKVMAEEKKQKQEQKNQDQNQDKGKDNKEDQDDSKESGENKENQEDKKSDDGKEDNDKENDKEQKSGNQEEQENNQQNMNPDEKKDQGGDEEKEEQGARGDKDPEDKTEEQSSEAQNQGEKDESGEQEKQNATILNRLEDKPGGALIPKVNPGFVEEDW